MKQRWILACMLLCSMHGLVWGQRKPPSIEEMNTHKWKYMVEHTPLTPAEAAKVQPIFEAYERAGWELHKTFHANFRKLKGSVVTDEQYRTLNRDYVELELKKAEQLKEYHKELEKALTPSQLYRFYNAEKEFKRHLFNPAKSENRQRGN